MRTEKRRLSRAEYERGLPGYHDPTGGFGGAAPAQSALTLRAWLAGVGMLVCSAGLLIFVLLDEAVPAVLLGIAALIALVDLGWVLHRKRRGEAG